MAPPLLIVIESDSDTDIEDLHFRPRDLKFKSLEHRHSFYRQHFSNTTIRLQDFKLPALCHQAPSLAPEIIEAYLARTTIVVNVWTNYDTAYKRFFTDRRIEDCGVIQLSPSASTKLVDMGIADYQFQTVVFEVGTAFRVLARIKVKVKRVNGVYTLRCTLTDAIENHDKFREELARVVQRLDHTELPPKMGWIEREQHTRSRSAF